MTEIKDSDNVMTRKVVIFTFNDHFNSHMWQDLVMVKQRAYSKIAKEASRLLGKQIQLARKQRKWSETNLAERAGISRTTLQKIEKGDMNCAIGLVFETATLVGINLFAQDRLPLPVSLERADEILALMPKRIHSKTKVVDDDF